jgi:hypothetical protein
MYVTRSPHLSGTPCASKGTGKDYPKARQSMDETSAAIWWNLCGRAWTEEDPVKFLDVTMQITKFLARKQQRLDAAYGSATTRPAKQSNSTKKYRELMLQPDSILYGAAGTALWCFLPDLRTTRKSPSEFQPAARVSCRQVRSLCRDRPSRRPPQRRSV